MRLVTAAFRWGACALLLGAPFSCGGKVIFEGPPDDGGFGGSTNSLSSTATGSGKDVDLGPICADFCAGFKHCAPVADCQTGCTTSFVSGCKKEYADVVVCEADHPGGCGIPPECNGTLETYNTCQANK